MNRLLVGVLFCLGLVAPSVAGITGNFRTFYFHRYYDIPQNQESLAVGGWLQYDSPGWQNFHCRLTGYTSQGLIFTDPNSGGGGILTDDQRCFSVLGQAALNWKNQLADLTLFRQDFDSPLINEKDTRMIPFLFEALTLKKDLNQSGTLYVSHVTRIKRWTDVDFVPMSQAAGLVNTDMAVTLAGFNLAPSANIKIKAWEYYCHDFMSNFYAQVDANWQLTKGPQLTTSAQTISQSSVGQSIGGNFSSGMVGLQGGLSWPDGLSVALAASSAKQGHDIYNPWGAYPGFTSIVEEDSDLAGEQAWAVKLSKDSQPLGRGIKKLALYHSQAYIKDKGSLSAADQLESDLIIEYQIASATSMLLRGANVYNSASTGGANYTSCRLSLNSSF